MIIVDFYARKRKYQEILDQRLLEIRFLRPEKTDFSLEKELGKFESLVTSFHSIKEISFEVSISSVDSSLRFYVSVSKNDISGVTRTLYSAFTGIDIRQVDEYSIFTEGTQNEVRDVKLKSFSGFPIRTYTELKVDSLASLFNILSSIKENEGASFQLIINPAKKSDESKISSVVDQAGDGKKVKDAIKTVERPFLTFLKSLQSSVINEDKEEEGKHVTIDDGENVK